MLTFILSVLVILVVALVVIIISDRINKRKRTQIDKVFEDGRFTTLISLVTMIFMVITIQEGQKGTDQTIAVLKSEVTRQISEYRNETSRHIRAIEESTKQFIDELRNAEKRNRSRDIKNMQREINRNYTLLVSMISNENRVTAYSGEAYNIFYDNFDMEMYDRGLFSKYIVDDNLYVLIQSYYDGLRVINKYLNEARDIASHERTSFGASSDIRHRNAEIIKRCKIEKVNGEKIATQFKVINKFD